MLVPQELWQPETSLQSPFIPVGIKALSASCQVLSSATRRDATGHCSPECGPHAFAVTSSCPKHPQCLWGHSIQPKTSRGEPGPARTAGGTARCILLFPLAQEKDRRAGPPSGGTFPKERSWNRRDCSLKAFLFIQALLKGGVWSRGEFRQI